MSSFSASLAKTAALPGAGEGAFPLDVGVSGIVASGCGLLVSAGGGHWGAVPHGGDALDYAWIYVNVAVVWTWLAVWPAISFSRSGWGRRALGWELGVLLLAFVPALSVAAFLSSVPARIACEMAVLQLSIGILAAGAMAWRDWVGAGVVAGILAALAFVLPVAAYFWAELFAVAPQGWRAFIPVIAAARAGHLITHMTWWAAASYGIVGLALLGAAPVKSR